MTRITGSVRDVGFTDLDGLLIMHSGFRSVGDAIVAPKRHKWTIVEGKLPDDVVVEPGPAVLELDLAFEAKDQWPVTVPDQDEVTLGDLMLGGFDWDEEVISVVYEYLREVRRLSSLVHDDRELSQIARQGSEDARDRAIEARNSAEQFKGQADASAAAASDSEAAAAASERNAKSSEQSAAEHDTNAASSASSSASSASQSSSSASAAAASEAAAQGYANDASDSLESTTAERVTVENIRTALEALLADSEAWAGFEEALSQLEPRMAAEVNKLKGDAPEAFDTLGEVAAWIADHGDEAAAMLQNISERAKTTYVDEQLSGKADKGAENTAQWSQVSGKPATFPSSWPEVSGKPSVFPPSTHSHEVSTLGGWKPYSTSVDDPNTVPTRDSKGHINVPLTPLTEYNVTSKSYVDSRFQVVDELPAEPDPSTIYLVRE